MPFRFDLAERQVYSLIAASVVVGLMVFGTGVLSGVRLAEQDESTRAAGANGLPTEAGAIADTAGVGAIGAVSAVSADDGERQAIYEIQLSSHLHREDTEAVVDTLVMAGYEAFVVETLDSRDNKLYTVRIGPWDSILEAADAADAFRERSGLQDFDPKIRHRAAPL